MTLSTSAHGLLSTGESSPQTELLNEILLNLSNRPIGIDERNAIIIDVARAVQHVDEAVDELVRMLRKKCAQSSV